MQLRNMEIFCEIVIRRSFSKAAKAYEVSQSSASQAVHVLEEHLETQLIDRTKRPFQLASAGSVYFEGCRKFLHSLYQMEDRVREMENQIVGRVEVAVIYSVGLLEMDSYIRCFESLYPRAKVHLEFLHPDEVYSKILNGEADFGIVSFPKDGGEIGCIPWQEQKMELAVCPRHRFAHRHFIDWEDLSGVDFIGFTKELRIRRMIDRWLKKAGVSIRVSHEFDNIENIKRAVEIGSGVAILPARTIQSEVDAGSIRGISLNGEQRFRPLGIMHKRNKSLSSAALKLVEMLREGQTMQGNNGSPVYSDLNLNRTDRGMLTRKRE